MIYANKRTILVVLTMCAIALSSVKAQEVRASIRRTRKTGKHDKKTKSSSESPSESLSESPTESPTELPSQSPSDSPTKLPSESPTKSPRPSEPPSRACKRSKLIAKFRTYSYTVALPQDLVIIEAVAFNIVEIAKVEIANSNILPSDVQPTSIDVNEYIGFVYSDTVLERNCEGTACSFSTETTICVLESADSILVQEFKGQLQNIKNFLDSYFTTQNADFVVADNPGNKNDTVELVNID